MVLRAPLAELEREIRLGERSNEPVSVVMIDVDDLGVYCQNNGHESGAEVVSSLLRLVRKCSRETDLVVCLGREDLTLILPQTTKASAGLVAERLLERVQRQNFPGESMQPGSKLTVSLGVATYPGDADTAESLVRNADRALYLAKSSGKNRVQLYDDNRRSLRREQVALDGTFSTFEIKANPLKTVDISPSGIRFSTKMALPEGALLDVQLRLPGTQQTVEMAVRVLRMAEIGAPSFGWVGGRPLTVGGGYEIAARTVEIARQDLRVLSEYLCSLTRSE